MITWSPDALDLFQRHCEERRGSLLALGADPDEVFSDWKSLIESHAAAAGENAVSIVRAQTELNALRSAAAEVPPLESTPAPSTAFPSKMRVWFARINTVLLWLFGVALPLGVLLFELAAGFCAEIFFDPIPSWLHSLLIALVPASNAWTLLAVSRGKPSRTAGLLNGFAMGISAYYAIQFAIITPFAAMAVIYFGIGLIPLAPLVSLLCAIALRQRLRKTAVATASPPPAACWRTALPAFALLILLGIPQSAVQIGAARANDSDPDVRIHAVQLLRAIGDRDTLLRKCYRTGENMDLTALLLSSVFSCDPGTVDAQQAYYRVTGTPYTAVPPPQIKGFRGQSLLDDDWFDPSLGGDQVAARVKGLSLSQSRLDGRIDSASGISYLEWTLEFRNASKTQREARALIELPPGAVVSRVTLWINDEPCEAAFGGRAQTKQAYQQVAVRQRRDPVLVTTAGPDRILVQCFPVPVDGTMKTRIGITAPLAVTQAKPAEAVLRLPAFVEQNFTATSNLSTSAWLESDVEPLASSSTLQTIAQDSAFAIRGKLPSDSTSPAGFLRVPLADPAPSMVSRDSRLPQDEVILQSLVPPNSAPAFPPALAIVIDGSSRMGPFRETITKSILDRIPPETATFTVLAGDKPNVINGRSLFGMKFVGGCDNVPALVQAAEWATAHGNAPILWLHAAQPLDSTETESLRQIADFARGKLVIHSHQFGPGANRISEKLADLQLIHPMPVVQAPPTEIVDLLSGTAAHWQREKIKTETLPAGVAEGSSHISRLWANDEIARLTAPHRKTGHDEALELARSFQLVTPISGAVVLETAAQYNANNLTPADPASAPGIVPEPATWMLLLTGAPFLLALRRRKSP